MKGKKQSRTVPLNEKVRSEIEKYLDKWEEIYEISIQDKFHLFHSQKTDGNNEKAISSRQAIHILQNVFNECELDGKLATHTMRKTYAKNIHEKLGKDILKTKKAMGNKDITSTTSYLSFDQKEIDDAIKNLNLNE
jgi:site-specific recombinase XerD